MTKVGTGERELKIDVKVGGKRETEKAREGNGKMEFREFERVEKGVKERA